MNQREGFPHMVCWQTKPTLQSKELGFLLGDQTVSVSDDKEKKSDEKKAGRTDGVS